MKKALDRLKLSLAWKLFPSAKLQIKTIHGVKVPLRARGDFASLEEIFVKQAYASLLEAIPFPVLSWVDLGCNAGIFSAWLYDRAGGSLARPDCRALMVEPGVCAETAREFVRLNGLSNFQVIQACIGNGQPVAFYESKSSTRSSSAIKPDSKEKVRHMETVSITSLLDEYSFQEADLLKVDIEGSERDVLCASDIFRRFRAGIIEWHIETTSGIDVVKWIETNGGKIVKMISQDGTVENPITSRLGMVAWVKAE
jgi:FkbM family methyltransferase